MTLVAVTGPDERLLVKWSELLQDRGHGCVIIPTPDLALGPGADAGICLYDLGPRGGVASEVLLAAVEALPSIRFIAMSARPETAEGLRLLRAGVRGYTNRLCSAEVLGALLATVDSGEIWAGRQVTDYLLNTRIAHGAPARDASAEDSGAALLEGLTSREAEIAGQVAAGLSNKVIAIENGISERTVKAHLNSIFRKTGIRNRVQLALTVAQAEHEPRKLSSA